MRRSFKLALLILNCLPRFAGAADVPVPRSVPGDKGRYFLIEMSRQGDVVKSLHKRVGPGYVGFTRMETNCRTMKYRDMGYSEEGPDKIKSDPTKWTDLVPGSSKFDMAHFVCKRSAAG